VDHGGWSASTIGTGLKAVAETEKGSTFGLLSDAAGTVMLRGSAGAWTTIGSNASAIWGGLEVPYMSMKDDPNTAADESKTIRRNATGSTWYKYALNTTSIMKGASRRVAPNTNGKLYAYVTP
jgi:hypothetical protein